ncbi:hypothetical protein GCM10027614_14730 [Micromonospora vulcania]
MALLGEIIDVQSRSAALRLPRAPGRNLAVLGTRVDEACAVLDAAARSLARQHPPGTARYSIACLDPDADPIARTLYDDLADDAAWYDDETVGELMAETADGLSGPGSPHYLLLFAVDAAAGTLAARAGRRTGLEQLRRILHDGPERRTHVLAWWRGWPGCARIWAGRPRVPTRSGPGWRWTRTAVNWAPRSTGHRRPGLVSPTVAGTLLRPGGAPHRSGDHPLWTVPMNEPVASDTYAAHLRRLAEVTARVREQRAEAHTWYDRQCAAADRPSRTPPIRSSGPRRSWSPPASSRNWWTPKWRTCGSSYGCASVPVRAASVARPHRRTATGPPIRSCCSGGPGTCWSVPGSRASCRAR